METYVSSIILESDNTFTTMEICFCYPSVPDLELLSFASNIELRADGNINTQKISDHIFSL